MGALLVVVVADEGVVLVPLYFVLEALPPPLDPGQPKSAASEYFKHCLMTILHDFRIVPSLEREKDSLPRHPPLSLLR